MEIVIVLATYNDTRREFLLGAAEALSQAGVSFEFNLWQYQYGELTESNLAAMTKRGVAGLIVDLKALLANHGTIEASSIPTVVFGAKPSEMSFRKGISFVANDGVAIGKRAADYLFSLGNFRDFVFFAGNSRHEEWSKRRGDGFITAMKHHRREVRTFDHRGSPLAFLTSLAKPAAIFADCDPTAAEVIALCRNAGFTIPEQIAVLGVDNNDLLCNFSRPEITSLHPLHHRCGGIAAQELMKYIQSRDRVPVGRQIYNDEIEIVTRESTAPIKPAAKILSDALNFMQENASRKITAEDVAAHLGISRRLLFLRFKEFGNETVAQAIRRIRLENLNRHLAVSTGTFAKTAKACGYANPDYLKRMLKVPGADLIDTVRLIK